VDKKIDATDRTILRILQNDCSVSIDSIAEKLGLSKNATWRRIRQLEANGTIRKQVALVDPAALGLGATAVVMIKTADHSADWLRKFRDAIPRLPNIQSAYRLTGDLDYMLRVRVSGIEDYDSFYQKLVELIDFSDVSTSFVMEEIVETTALPVPDPD
jgi:Lrp/AsnC family transcriptional regulator